MKNCFVRKLKDSFSDENLPVYDTLTIDIIANNKADYINLVIGNVNTSYNDYTLSLTNSNQFYNNTGVALGSSGIMNDLKVSWNGQDDGVFYGTVNIGQINSKLRISNRYNITRFATSGYAGISADLNDFAYCKEMHFLSINTDNFGTNFATGSINNLGRLTKMTELRVAYTEVEGSLEAMAQAMVGNGRTSGSLVVKAKGSMVTYQGYPLANTSYTITFSGGSYSIA